MNHHKLKITSIPELIERYSNDLKRLRTIKDLLTQGLYLKIEPGFFIIRTSFENFSKPLQKKKIFTIEQAHLSAKKLTKNQYLSQITRQFLSFLASSYKEMT